ncbi:MAG: hypothetical protein WCI73_09865 [Phycisphaerae bacterium]
MWYSCRIFRLTLFGTLTIAASCLACNVPVFRYALDRWPPGEFVLRIPEAVASNGDGAACTQALSNRPSLNIHVKVSRGATETELFLPDGTTRVWTGRPDKGLAEAIATSPARQQIAHHLTSGDSAVWVVLGTADPSADEKAIKILSERLRYLESVRTLPSPAPATPEDRIGHGPALRNHFSIIRIGPEDPAEILTRAMLQVHSEARVGKLTAIPVFGRGRALGALPADSWTPDTIDAVCSFLLGACSCQAKELNPGWDLAIDFDWSEALARADTQRDDEAPQTEASNHRGVPETLVIAGQPPSRAANPYSEGVVILLLAVVGSITACIVLDRIRRPGR